MRDASLDAALISCLVRSSPGFVLRVLFTASCHTSCLDVVSGFLLLCSRPIAATALVSCLCLGWLLGFVFYWLDLFLRVCVGKYFSIGFFVGPYQAVFLCPLQDSVSGFCF